MSKSPFLQQFLADILQKDIVISPSEECTALGVAMMAAKGLDRTIDNFNIANTIIKTPQYSQKEALRLYEKWLEAVSRSKKWA